MAMKSNPLLGSQPGQMGGVGLLAQQLQQTPPMPPGFPNQLGLLAQQMNQGFGGGLDAQMQYLNSIFKPIEPTYLPDPLKPKPDDPKKPDDKKTDRKDNDDFRARLRDHRGWR